MLMPEDLEPIGVRAGELGHLELDVHVTATDIKVGTACDTGTCPVALAILTAAREAGFQLADDLPIEVTERAVRLFGQQSSCFVGQLPDSAQDFIETFDSVRDHDAQPFRFHIRLEAV